MIDVRVQSDGAHWRAAWREDGVLRRRSIGKKAGMSAEEARLAAKALEHQLVKGLVVAGRSPTLEAWSARYLEQHQGSDGRVANVTKSCDYLMARLGRTIRLDAITRNHAAEWVAWLNGKGFALATVRSHVASVKALFSEAMRRDLCAINPFDRQTSSTPRAEKTWRHFTHEEIGRLIDAGPSPAWRALIALCSLGGLRRGEALRLEWPDIGWSQGRLTVRASTRYTTCKSRTRVVRMEPELESILLDVHESTGEARVAHVNESCVLREMRKAIDRAGLEQYDKPFHTLRKWREATWQAVHPVMYVCEWLGHAPDVAREHYLRVPDEAYVIQPERSTHGTRRSTTGRCDHPGSAEHDAALDPEAVGPDRRRA